MNFPPGELPLQAGSEEPGTDHESDDEDEMAASFFEVRALPRDKRPQITEQDAVADACRCLAQCLRSRPTLPPKPDDATAPWEDVFSAARLPLWHCAFLGCTWWGDGQDELLQHLHASHQDDFARCRALTPHTRRLTDADLYEEGIAMREREQIPAVGPSVDRRTIELVLQNYNDDAVRSLVCFACGQIKTQTPGKHADIERKSEGWLASRGSKTLEANLGWNKWFEQHGSTEPLVRYGPGQHEDNPRAEWCCRLDSRAELTSIDVFGCPEDWLCEAPVSSPRAGDCNAMERLRRLHINGRTDDVLTLCKHCTLPFCRACQIKLASAGGRSSAGAG